MKVAIYEPFPRICGPVIWAKHLQTGFKKLGHECDIVTVTKNGKPCSHWGDQEIYSYGFQWCAYMPDKIFKLGFKHDKIQEDFAPYDLVILTEPKHGTFDRRTKKSSFLKDGVRYTFGEGESKLHATAPEDIEKPKYAYDPNRPLYIQVLEKMNKPWISALHGPQYDERRAPHLEECLSAGKFVGKLLTPSMKYVNERFTGIEFVEYPQLPYRLSTPIDAPIPKGIPRIAGFAGRVVPNKGPQFLVELAAQDWIDCDVEIWGASAVSISPALTKFISERLEKDDWKLEWFINPKHVPDALRPHRWKATKDGRRIQYHGNYEDALKVFGRFPVHVNFTSANFSFGLIEFVGLEGLEAGCVGVYPPHTLGAAPYEVKVLDGFSNPPGIQGDTVRLDRVDGTMVINAVQRIREALDMPHAQRLELAKHNREIIAEHHDPAKYAQALLDMV